LAIDFPDLPDPQAMFDIQYFSQDPRPFFKFAREIYPGQFKPSPCHRYVNYGGLYALFMIYVMKLYQL
jgi:NAD-dependent deacetylase sirtuin 1